MGLAQLVVMEEAVIEEVVEGGFLPQQGWLALVEGGQEHQVGRQNVVGTHHTLFGVSQPLTAL